ITGTRLFPTPHPRRAPTAGRWSKATSHSHRYASTSPTTRFSGAHSKWRPGSTSASRDPDRYLRLALCALARRFLPEGPPAAPGARVLRAALRERRAERLLLFLAAARVLRSVVRGNAAGVRVQREGLALHHAHA